MKRYEGIKREETAIHCPKCNEEIGFADMVCPHCGADARVEKRIYRPGLSSNDIQPAPRERVGGPHKPQNDYAFKAIDNVGMILTLTAIILAVVIGYLVGNFYDDTVIGILSGILSALVLVCLARAISIALKNTAFAALNNERIALGVEYQIEQMNELITAYNRDKNIEADNAEVFAKLLVKISKLEEAQKNSTEELANIAGAISRKLNKTPLEYIQPTTEETEFTDDFDDEEAEETTADIAAEPVEEITEEPAEKAVEEAPEEKNAVEETPDESVEAEESNSEEETEEFYTIECPKCGGDIKYTEEQLDNGGADLVCEKCGAAIELEVQNEEDEKEAEEAVQEPERDAQDEYERVFGSDEPIASSSLTSRLEAFLDDEDDD